MNNEIKSKAENQLFNVIVPYWNNLIDREHGGFYGYVDHDLHIDKTAHKGVILHSRILWFYSSLYRATNDAAALKNATHAYDFLRTHCMDTVHGGLYWMMNHDGTAFDTTKNAYNQAFGIYALSSYYKASGNADALQYAYRLFECIESYCTDSFGYLESFTRDWKTATESAICDQGVVAEKTMNTLLHVLEAYTELLSADSHPIVAQKLVRILALCRDKLYNPALERLEVFFDSKMNPLGDIHSFGHDIEASWLLDRACEVLTKHVPLLPHFLQNEAQTLIADTTAYTSTIAHKILAVALKNGALDNESRGEKSGTVHTDTMRVWWVQAEAVVGFWNEYQKSGEEAFKDAVLQLLTYIESTVADKRPLSEWFGYVDQNGVPKPDSPMSEAWKCPYHNGRMCLEIMQRLNA